MGTGDARRGSQRRRASPIRLVEGRCADRRRHRQARRQPAASNAGWGTLVAGGIDEMVFDRVKLGWSSPTSPVAGPPQADELALRRLRLVRSGYLKAWKYGQPWPWSRPTPQPERLGEVPFLTDLVLAPTRRDLMVQVPDLAMRCRRHHRRSASAPNPGDQPGGPPAPGRRGRGRVRGRPVDTVAQKVVARASRDGSSFVVVNPAGTRARTWRLTSDWSWSST